MLFLKVSIIGKAPSKDPTCPPQRYSRMIERKRRTLSSKVSLFKKHILTLHSQIYPRVAQVQIMRSRPVHCQIVLRSDWRRGDGTLECIIQSFLSDFIFFVEFSNSLIYLKIIIYYPFFKYKSRCQNFRTDHHPVTSL